MAAYTDFTTLAELKTNCRVPHARDDVLLEILAEAAYADIEVFLDLDMALLLQNNAAKAAIRLNLLRLVDFLYNNRSAYTEKSYSVDHHFDQSLKRLRNWSV